MSVAQTAERISKQAGNDVTTAFSGSWKIFAASDLRVEKINAAGVYSGALTNGVDYTVVFDSDAETWTVTYTTAPVSTGYAVILGTEMPQTQGSNFPREGMTPAATAKNALDKLTVLVQQLRDRLDRAPLQPLTPVNPNNQIAINSPTHRRALVYTITGSDVAVVPSEYDPDQLFTLLQALVPTYAEGLLSARAAAPASRMAYYATDTGEYAHYIPTAGRWFTLG